MSHKSLPIDWNELEFALTWHSDEGGHYLDVTSGQIVAFTGLDDELAEGEIDAGLEEGRLIPIEPCRPRSSTAGCPSSQPRSPMPRCGAC